MCQKGGGPSGTFAVGGVTQTSCQKQAYGVRTVLERSPRRVEESSKFARGQTRRRGVLRQDVDRYTATGNAKILASKNAAGET